MWKMYWLRHNCPFKLKIILKSKGKLNTYIFESTVAPNRKKLNELILPLSSAGYAISWRGAAGRYTIKRYRNENSLQTSLRKGTHSHGLDTI